MNTNFFSIRVYGLWINDNHEIMLTDEYFQDKFLTKFPGGGLEFGEGIHECLKREWLEELNIEIDIIEHFYTTDFFQVSVFNPNAQIVSIYYLVKPLSVPDVKISNKVFDFDELKNGSQVFRWVAISELDEDQITLSIDKKVASMLKSNFLLKTLL